MSHESQVLVVFVTVPDQESATKISNLVIEKHLAACVNVIPNISSIYHWQGKVEQDTELLLIMKTTEALYSSLESAVVVEHPYDTPEVVALRSEHVYEKYALWVTKEAKLC